MRRIIIMVAALTIAATSFSQKVEDPMITLNRLCRDVLNLQDSIKLKKKSLEDAESEYSKMREEWKAMCEDVLSDPNRDPEFIETLVSYTSKEYDGEDLYNRLCAVRVDPNAHIAPPLLDKKPAAQADIERHDLVGNEGDDPLVSTKDDSEIYKRNEPPVDVEPELDTPPAKKEKEGNEDEKLKQVSGLPKEVMPKKDDPKSSDNTDKKDKSKNSKEDESHRDIDVSTLSKNKSYNNIKKK